MKWKVQLDNNLNKLNQMIFSCGTVNRLVLDENIEQEELFINVKANACLTIMQKYIQHKPVTLKLKLILEENAQVIHHLLIKTDSIIACTYEFKLIGSGASLKSLSSVYITGNGLCTIRVQQIHKASETTSSLHFKTALIDQASYDYQGHIAIQEKAFNAQAHQKDIVLLGNLGTTAVSIPSLEVLCNIVQCGHATAIARINDNQLTMLANRGINSLKAKQLIVDGFLELNTYDKL